MSLMRFRPRTALRRWTSERGVRALTAIAWAFGGVLGYLDDMTEIRGTASRDVSMDGDTASITVAVVANPQSDKGSGARISRKVLEYIRGKGLKHHFAVRDLTGDSFEESLSNARTHREDYDYLIVVGGDGMIALGVNAVQLSGKPLGIVAIGSGNDFARGLHLPVNRVHTALEGIVAAIAERSSMCVDLGRITLVDDAGNEKESRYYAGMLSCGIDASVNLRANRSHLPNGKVRYFVALLVELMHMKRYGYHMRAVLEDGTVEERNMLSMLLTIANSRHIGGGIEVSPYSKLSDGMLDLVWMNHVPNVKECAVAIRNAYNGKLLLTSDVFGWKRVRSIEISGSGVGARPPELMADGEGVGSLPVRVEVESNALRVLAPPSAVQDALRRDKDSQVNVG
jgi:diacylglycerol kinase (ATP)